MLQNRGYSALNGPISHRGTQTMYFLKTKKKKKKKKKNNARTLIFYSYFNRMFMSFQNSIGIPKANLRVLDVFANKNSIL